MSAESGMAGLPGSGAEGQPQEEAGFRIDGTVYPVPSIWDFDMDEAEIFYEYTGLAIEDFVPLLADLPGHEPDDELARKMKHPRFRRALLHVAYRRGNPDVSAAEIREAVGRVHNLGSFVSLVGGRGDADGPPSEESTSTHNGRSTSGSLDSTTDSGKRSPKSSDAPDVPPEPIGTTGSATSRTSALKALAG